VQKTTLQMAGCPQGVFSTTQPTVKLACCSESSAQAPLFVGIFNATRRAAAADDDEKREERSHFFLPYQTRLTTQVATAAAAATNKSRKQK